MSETVFLELVPPISNRHRQQQNPPTQHVRHLHPWLPSAVQFFLLNKKWFINILFPLLQKKKLHDFSKYHQQRLWLVSEIALAQPILNEQKSEIQ